MGRLLLSLCTGMCIAWLCLTNPELSRAQPSSGEDPLGIRHRPFLTDSSSQLLTMLDDGQALLRVLRAVYPARQEQVQKAIRLDLRNFAFGLVQVVEARLSQLSTLPSVAELPALSRAARRAIRRALLRSPDSFRADRRRADGALELLRAALSPPLK